MWIRCLKCFKTDLRTVNLTPARERKVELLLNATIKKHWFAGFHNCVWDDWQSGSKLAYVMKMTPPALNADEEEQHRPRRRRSEHTDLSRRRRSLAVNYVPKNQAGRAWWQKHASRAARANEEAVTICSWRTTSLVLVLKRNTVG